MTEDEATNFSNRPDVQSVSRNDPVRVLQTRQPAGGPTAGPTAGPTSGPTAAPAPAPPKYLYPSTQQAAAAWNLNRLIHPSLPLGTDFNYTSDGTGVNVYVVDTVRGRPILPCIYILLLLCGPNAPTRASRHSATLALSTCHFPTMLEQ